MPISVEQSLQFARQLMTVPDFPRAAEAVLATSEDLRELVQHVPDQLAEKRITWLIHQIRHHCRKWSDEGGTAMMVALYRKEFEPEPVPGNGFRDLGRKPPIECQNCNDTGIRRTGLTEFVWCNCGAGLHAREHCPALLDLCRGRTGVAIAIPTPRPVKCSQCQDLGMVSVEGEYIWCDCPYARELNLREPDYVNRWNQAVRYQRTISGSGRCPECDGTGFKPGSNEYCSCQLGRDLERIENRGGLSQ